MEINIHLLAVFEALDVVGVGDCGGVVDGVVNGDDCCAGGLEFGDHGVESVVDGGGFVACGAVEESVDEAEAKTFEGTGCERSGVVDPS